MSSRSTLDIPCENPHAERETESTNERDPTLQLEKSAIWVMFGRGLGIAATAGLTLLLPRLLSKAVNGELVVLFSLVGFSAGLAAVGLPTAWIRLISEQLAHHAGDSLKATLRQGFRLLAIATSCVGLVLCVYMASDGMSRFQLTPNWALPMLLALAVMLLGWQLATAAAIRGFHEVKWSSLFSGGQIGGPIVVLLFLALVGCARLIRPEITAIEALFLLTAALAVTLPLALWRLRRVQSFLNWPEQPRTSGDYSSSCPTAKNAPTLRGLFRICLPLALAQIAAFFTLSADIWIAGICLDRESVALLGYSKRLLLLVSLPSQLAILTIISSISDLHARGKLAELQKMMRSAATIAAIPALAAGVLLLAAPGFMLELAFTAEYRPAAPLLVAFTLAQLVSSCLGIAGYVLAMTGREDSVLAINLVTALIMIPAGIAGALWGGLHGLAYASAAVLALQAVLEWGFTRGLTGVWTHLDPRTPVLPLLVKSISRLLPGGKLR